ncbi:response regulator [Spirosoma daeguense]
MQTQDRPFDVLVVDDDSSVSDLLSLVGRREFVEATFISVSTALEALYFLDDPRNCQPSLILLDIDLRDALDGIELIPLLQARVNRKIPIVMLSHCLQKNYVRRSYQAGAAAYTRKPEELVEWRTYVNTLKQYWYNTTLLPKKES